jgi:hypothetical protein
MSLNFLSWHGISWKFQVLQRILMGTDVVKNVNKNNASHAVLFEALSLVSSSDSWGNVDTMNFTSGHLFFSLFPFTPAQRPVKTHLLKADY